jgi:hypothetical protein
LKSRTEQLILHKSFEGVWGPQKKDTLKARVKNAINDSPTDDACRKGTMGFKLTFVKHFIFFEWQVQLKIYNADETVISNVPSKQIIVLKTGKK